jgi:ectoine hydroxylase-related dioxygenase (phytanoyl-CoA dioxygenase family)
VLDAQEEDMLAEIRKALGDVEAKERELAGRLKMEREEADAAASKGDINTQLAHERRAAELQHHLEEESIFAINLEEKLAALEEKLALAQDAVNKEAKKTAERAAAADNILSQEPPAAQTNPASPAPVDDTIDLDTRKSRLTD